jgi:hypothetical protein
MPLTPKPNASRRTRNRLAEHPDAVVDHAGTFLKDGHRIPGVLVSSSDGWSGWLAADEVEVDDVRAACFLDRPAVGRRYTLAANARAFDADDAPTIVIPREGVVEVVAVSRFGGRNCRVTGVSGAHDPEEFIVGVEFLEQES